MPWQDIGTLGPKEQLFTPQFCTAGYNLNHYFTVNPFPRSGERDRERERQKTRPKKAEDGFFYPDGRTDLVRLIKEKCPSVRFVSGGFSAPREEEEEDMNLFLWKKRNGSWSGALRAWE